MTRSCAALAMAWLTACGSSSTDTPVDSDTAPTEPSYCDAQSLPTRAFQAAEGEAAISAIAGDFTAPTRDEDWVFSEQYTGCTSYIFFVHFPGINDDTMTTDVDALFKEAPDNVEYFFMSDAEDRASRNAFLDSMTDVVEDGLQAAFRKEEKRATWRERVHFVTKRASNIDGSIGEYVTRMVALSRDPAAYADLGDRGQAPVPLPEVFGIDRGQRFDPGGNLSPYVGSPRDQLNIAAWLGHFYNYRHELDTRMDDEPDVTVVQAMGEVTTGRVFTKPITLPDAATMASFDTLEIDVTVDCRLDNPFSCSEWDRIAAIYWCEDGEECSVRREITRWITPYWRRGRQRYALEASPMISMMRDGGEQYVYIMLGPSWERATEWYAEVNFRFRDQGGRRPIAAVPLFTGGGFGDTYNDREPVAFTAPEGADSAELVAIVSGHGQVSGNNCAEWCDHRHTFSVDGTALETIAHEGDDIFFDVGCAKFADRGVMPGQWGNWAQMRAYWCPGMEVFPHRLDVTQYVTPGQAGEVDYEASFGTATPAGGDISLASYLVFYEDP